MDESRGATGTYLRVVVPGEIRAGDRIEAIRRPRHTVTVGRSFRALTAEAELLTSVEIYRSSETCRSFCDGVSSAER